MNTEDRWVHDPDRPWERDEDDAGGLDAKGWSDLRHAIRGVGHVRASFDVVDGVVTERSL